MGAAVSPSDRPLSDSARTERELCGPSRLALRLTSAAHFSPSSLPGPPLPAFVRAFSCPKRGSCCTARAIYQALPRPNFYTPAPEQLANEGGTDMTRTEFQNWAKAANLRTTTSLEAARMVLTGDMRPGEAARAVGASPQAVTNTLRKIKDAMAAATAPDVAPQ